MRKIYFFIYLFICIGLSAKSQNTSEELLKKGDELSKYKEYDRAIKLYDSCISIDKYAILAYFNKGQALEFLQRFEAAIENYSTLLSMFPQLNPPLTRRGISYIKIQKYQEGIADLEKANKQDPNNPQILCNLGLGKIGIKDTSGITDLNNSILLDSSNYEAYYNRGLGKILLGNSESSIQDFEHAIKLKPDFGQAYFSIGLAKFQLGLKEQACNFWKQSIDKGYKRAQVIIDQNCN